jgi:NAD(P)-dependent dehydrogenase (short-subunit alcohol dehydrogenase family)
LSKNVLITGVNGGIGSPLAHCFKQAGWSVIGMDIKGDKNKSCDLFLKTDISDSGAVKQSFHMISGNYTHLNCIINNAAIQYEKTFIETSDEEWETVFQVNVHGIFYLAKHFVGLLAGGSIVNISSVHSRATSIGLAAYAASKGAVAAMTRVMALELAEHGIRVNAILPGAVQSPMLEKGLKRHGDPDIAENRLIEATPLKKIGRPVDVANLALFLADEMLSGNITGQEFVCDGGVLAKLCSE